MATRVATGLVLLCASPKWSPRLPGSPGRRANHPLAPSSAPDAMAPPGSHANSPSHPSAAPACQRARPARRDSLGTADATSAASPAPSGHPFRARGSLLSGARKAYRTSVPVSRDTNRRLVDAAHTKRSRVVPSLKELRKLTIQKNAMSSGMQVVVRDARHTGLSLVPVARQESYQTNNTMSSALANLQAQP